jgi:D-aminoacyl-tRNA deacylase
LIGLLQRVSSAQVSAAGETLGAIESGVLVFVGVERDDSERQADRLLERILGYRIFPDRAGRMNLSVRETGGGILLVPQFTLAADTRKGMRPSFDTAAAPEEGRRLFGYLVQQTRKMHGAVQAGRFGADMKVALVNEGPVTFLLHVLPLARTNMGDCSRAS